MKPKGFVTSSDILTNWGNNINDLVEAIQNSQRKKWLLNRST